MAVDTRREQAHIFKEYDRFQKKVGESAVWFMFDTTNSAYDDVYDEGGKVYQSGILIPVLWVDEIEDMESYQETGRRTTKRIRLAVSARSMNETGIGAVDVHFNRVGDPIPDDPWIEDRLNDVFYYRSRFYEVTNFQLRGRMRSNTVVGISGIETQLADERVFDPLFPGLS